MEINSVIRETDEETVQSRSSNRDTNRYLEENESEEKKNANGIMHVKLKPKKVNNLESLKMYGPIPTTV
jgi:hypothetical protein